MKKTILILFAVIFIASCSKKSVPATSNNTPAPPAPTNTTVGSDNGTATPTTIPPTVTTRVPSVNAMIVIDGNGRILTPKDKLPVEDNLNPDYGKIARAFTPA